MFNVADSDVQQCGCVTAWAEGWRDDDSDTRDLGAPVTAGGAGGEQQRQGASLHHSGGVRPAEPTAGRQVTHVRSRTSSFHGVPPRIVEGAIVELSFQTWIWLDRPLM